MVTWEMSLVSNEILKQELTLAHYLDSIHHSPKRTGKPERKRVRGMRIYGQFQTEMRPLV